VSVFPATSLTLIQRIAVDVTGGKEAAWARFFELYTPAMRRFIELNDSVHDPDDVIQDVYVKLVEILESRRYDADKSRFHTFLAMLIRHQLISLYRKERSRGAGMNVPLEECESAALSIGASQADEIDLSWARAKHEAAVEHVLTKTALSVRTKAVYRALVMDGHSIEQTAQEFGIDQNLVRQIRFRVEKAIAVVEEEFADQ